MLVKFYADHHNARFVWSWKDGEYTTEDQQEIDNYIGIGLRHHVINTPIEEPKPKQRRKRKQKVD